VPLPRRKLPEPRIGPIASGVKGRIQLGRYAIAADVEGYVVERDARQQTIVRAHIRHGDDYKLAQAPLTFIVTLQRGEWHWPVLDVLQYRDHAFTARLGAAVALGGPR
jgi:hypothetical protein